MLESSEDDELSEETVELVDDGATDVESEEVVEDSLLDSEDDVEDEIEELSELTMQDLIPD